MECLEAVYARYTATSYQRDIRPNARQCSSLLADTVKTEDLETHSKRTRLLHLTDNLLCATKTLDHLLAFLPPPDGVVALLEQIVKLVGPVHLLQQLALHVFFRVPGVLLAYIHVFEFVQLTRQA